MAATFHQLWNPGLALPSLQEKPPVSPDWLWKSQENSNPYFPYNLSKESLWRYGLDNLGKEPSEADFSVPSSMQGGAPYEMYGKGSLPYVALLRTCAKNKDLDRGTRLHLDILKRGLFEKCSDALITMYAKCGALRKAQELLDIHSTRDIFTWTAMISEYVRSCQNMHAICCFEKMRSEGLTPDAVAYVCVLKACGNIRAIERGEQIHNEVASLGLLGNHSAVSAAVIDMYIKCGALARAQCVLEELPSRDALCWNALIAGYAHHGQGDQALICFEHMESEGVSPNAVTFACILKACATLGALEKGRHIHDAIAKQRLLENDAVLASALVDMYAKCGALERAKEVLDGLPSRNVFTWSALIAGYTQQGRGEQALHCFEEMCIEGISPDAVTFACVLQACGIVGAVDKGERIHEEVSKQGLLVQNVVLGTALVDMYAKCGALSKAAVVLEHLPCRDTFSWNSLIAGHAKEGQNEQALTCFERMQHEGFPPDVATFSSVLNACSHLGLVEEAHMHFINMSARYGLKPDVEQYTCMVDLFGRAGHFEKALEMIEEMPSSDCPAVWRALLAACRKWGEVEVGRWAFEQSIKADKSDGAAYVLMANIYSAAGMWEEAKLVEDMQAANNA